MREIEDKFSHIRFQKDETNYTLILATVLGVVLAIVGGLMYCAWRNSKALSIASGLSEEMALAKAALMVTDTITQDQSLLHSEEQEVVRRTGSNVRPIAPIRESYSEGLNQRLAIDCGPENVVPASP